MTKYYSKFKDIQVAEGAFYDVYIIGSDQIWNTKYTNCDPVFLLQFADASKKKISIASSFACKELDENMLEYLSGSCLIFHLCQLENLMD